MNGGGSSRAGLIKSVLGDDVTDKTLTPALLAKLNSTVEQAGCNSVARIAIAARKSVQQVPAEQPAPVIC